LQLLRLFVSILVENDVNLIRADFKQLFLALDIQD